VDAASATVIDSKWITRRRRHHYHYKQPQQQQLV